MIGAMRAIEELLGERPVERQRPYILRTHQPGDMGWVVARHGVLYTQEYGWDETFEGLVAEIAGEFLQKYDPKKERCWIAEQDGENVGSIFLVKKTATVAKLRLLIVDPKARGSGIGRRLVSECVRHARQVGYKKMTLWTQSHLHAARKLYQEAGFQLTESWAVHSWGKDMVSETWDLDLEEAGRRVGSAGGRVGQGADPRQDACYLCCMPTRLFEALQGPWAASSPPAHPPTCLPAVLFSPLPVVSSIRGPGVWS